MQTTIGWRISAIPFCLLLSVPYPLQAACREMDVARAFIPLAYAAELDATIQYFGHNFFQITTGKGTKVITDPLALGMYPAPNVAPHIVTIGREHPNHNYVALARGHPVILRGLIHFGADWNRVSMNIREVFIYSIPIYQNGVDGGFSKGAAFVFDLGTLCIAHLGNLSHLLSREQLKQMGKVDIALIPIDGTVTMGPDVARQVLQQLKPKIAIPMHYRDNLSLVREFRRGFNWYYLRGDMLTVSKSLLPPSTEIFILKPQDVRDDQ
ncbi:MAG: MBL fold metallo-hydrolase [Candidatus Binatia bacterium]